MSSAGASSSGTLSDMLWWCGGCVVVCVGGGGPISYYLPRPFTRKNDYYIGRDGTFRRWVARSAPPKRGDAGIRLGKQAAAAKIIRRCRCLLPIWGKGCGHVYDAGDYTGAGRTAR